ncbi:MAG TPA: FG-GAP-like repeat-containing protein [Ignavibacteria bacterium]|nr:FG-GAP-like repeat-containing protein [Ignavibacteria bacterium]HRJ04511.1 FG-GAP-like repeat-containing protein [Ignavibacteria bacterium]
MNRIILLLLIVSGSLVSQNLHQRFDGMDFIINGVNSVNPFNGGIEIPRYQFIDIDGDSDLDLFIYDRDTTLNFYRNEGNANVPLFRLNTTRYQNLNIRNWFKFADMDGDGDIDLFCGGDSQRVRYYKNIGSITNPAFSLQLYGIKTDINEYMSSESASVPTIVDIDADGDLDFLTGSSTGEITYFQNIGNAQNFNFKFITSRFANILIVGGADDPRHGASSIMFADIDGDNDRDLFWGDLFGLSIYYIKNTGTAQNFQFTTIDTNSPPPNYYFSGGFNMPGIYDIDNDGRNDLFIGVLIGSKSIDNFVHFRNNGPINNPTFTKITDNVILSADIGAYSYPAFGDIDNDGDKDLFIGCGNSVGFYRNTGTATAPAFALVTDSLPLSISNFNYSVSIGDLNGDGKKDLVLGYYSLARLRYFRNTGTLSDPLFTYTASQLDTMNLSQASAPCLADLDNDGDLDIITGNSGGKLTYYRNNGSASVFNFQLISNNYAGVNVGNDAAPSLGDLDGDGDLDLLVGNRLGQIAFYRNTGSVTSPVFTFVTSNYAGINAFQNSVPAIVDINGDTDPDLFVGNIKGGLYYYENWDVFGIQQIGSEIPEDFSLQQNYPNPFNPVTKIKFNVKAKGRSEKAKINLIIFDLLGKEVARLVNGELAPGTYEVDFDASNLPSGVYFYKLVSGEFSDSKRMVLVK